MASRVDEFRRLDSVWLVTTLARDGAAERWHRQQALISHARHSNAVLGGHDLGLRSCEQAAARPELLVVGLNLHA